MNISNNIIIEGFTPDTDQLNVYALAFRKSYHRWINDLGESIYMTSEGFEEDAKELHELISKTSPSKCIPLLKKYKILPEKLYRLTETSTGLSNSLLIYTGIRQISLEGQGSIIAEAFFGAEIHLLDAAGRILSICNYNYSPELGVGNLIRKNLDIFYNQNSNEIIDTYFSNESIVDYSQSNLKKSHSFPTQKGGKYYVKNEFQTIEVIDGTGDFVNLSSIHSLGWHQITNFDPSELPIFSENEKIFNFHVGLEWKDIHDFTIQYNTFPFLNGRDNWIMQYPILNKEEIYKLFFNKCKDDLFILDQLKNDPCSFQFMPTEIRSSIYWVEKFCLIEPVNFLFVENSLKNNISFATNLIEKTDKQRNTIYPYLSEKMRKNLDVLMVMKKLGRLFDLPDKNDIGSAKFDDIRSFILDNKSSLVKIIDFFPNVIQYIPNELYANEDDLPF